jgi:hypothetical protein
MDEGSCSEEGVSHAWGYKDVFGCGRKIPREMKGGDVAHHNFIAITAVFGAGCSQLQLYHLDWGKRRE